MKRAFWILTFAVSALGGASALADHFSTGTVVSCYSHDDKYNYCRVNGPISFVQLRHQESHADCIQGRSWGYDGGGIWVDRGCRADFDVFFGSYPPPHPYPPAPPAYQEEDISCASFDGRYERCFTSYIRRVDRAVVIQQLSNRPCILGRSWGYTPDSVWVTDGCRASFRVWGY